MKREERSVLEICSKCHDIADLQGKKVCYWCELEAASKNHDVYDLPINYWISTEEIGDEL